MKNKNYFWAGALVVIVVIVLIIIFSGGNGSDNELEKVTFQISWFHGPQYAFVYIAKDKGFFEDEGLDVTILENKGSAITSQLLASDEFSVGMVSAEAAMIAKSKGLPLTVVAVADKISPSGVTCHKSAGVNTAKDLEGKKVGVTITSNAYQQYLAFVKNEGLDREKIEEVPIGGAGVEFLAGEVDCHALYPFLSEAAAETEGMEVNSLIFYDSGLEMYGQTIVANSNTLKENPELVGKITRALVKGLKYERANYDEALASSFKLNPQIVENKDYHTKVFERRMALDQKLSDVENAGDGIQSREIWEKTKDILTELELLNGDINLDDFFTNRFVE